MSTHHPSARTTPEAITPEFPGTPYPYGRPPAAPTWGAVPVGPFAIPVPPPPVRPAPAGSRTVAGRRTRRGVR